MDFFNIFEHIWACFDPAQRGQGGAKILHSGKDSTNQYHSKKLSINILGSFLSMGFFDI